MQELDNEFFEAYKRLDRLCSDMYGCRNGVSQYIDDLEHVSYRDCLAVPMVEASCKRLKHLRWVRNQIAHDPGQFQICKECDIRQVNDFYDDIMTGNDPLTKLSKCHETNISVKRQTPSAKYEVSSAVSNSHGRNSSAWRPWLFGAVFLTLIGAAIFACLRLHLL